MRRRAPRREQPAPFLRIGQSTCFREPRQRHVSAHPITVIVFDDPPLCHSHEREINMLISCPELPRSTAFAAQPAARVTSAVKARV
jgi:hypothetical protein